MLGGMGQSTEIVDEVVWRRQSKGSVWSMLSMVVPILEEGLASPILEERQTVGLLQKFKSLGNCAHTKRHRSYSLTTGQIS